MAVYLGTANADASETFDAQGGRWSRDVETQRSPYFFANPMIGTGDTKGQPVSYATREWQRLLNSAGYAVKVDGVYGPRTRAAVVRYQRANKIEQTGVVGYQTAKSLLTPVVEANAKKYGHPADLLMCHLAAESNLDAGAVGPNGSDLGVAQIALTHNADVSTSEAFDVTFAIEYMAKRNAAAFKRYGNWKIAVVSYNSPAAALEWSKTGKPSERAVRYSGRAFSDC